MKTFFFPHVRFLTDKNSVGICNFCDMPLFISNYKGQFVYLCMPRTRRLRDRELPIEERIQRWNNKGTRKMCVSCMLKSEQSRKSNIQRLEHFISMKDNTHEVVMGELAK